MGEIVSRMESERFLQSYREKFELLSDLQKKADEAKQNIDALKLELKEAMEKHNIIGIDNDWVKVSYVNPSESVSLDTKALRTAEPDEYWKLIGKYKKTTSKSSYIRVKFK